MSAAVRSSLAHCSMVVADFANLWCSHTCLDLALLTSVIASLRMSDHLCVAASVLRAQSQ